MTSFMVSASPLPASAECRCVLADGRILTITATRRPRANRADVKCAVPGDAALGERMQEVVRLARHTENRFDSRDQVVLSMDIAPSPQDRSWELAAVLADRQVRGLPPFAPRLYAQGWSDAWHLGRVCGDAAQAIAAVSRHLGPEDKCIIGDDASLADAAHANITLIQHLGALSGHADPSAAVSGARAWFPLHSGGVNDALNWVEVSVYPVATSTDDEESAISAPGLDLTTLNAVRQTLIAARHFDGKGLGCWRTVIRFCQPRFQGDSYQLALVMADRLARGRDFVPRGRIIATGCSSAWHAGRVETVEGREPKLDLILKHASRGDRILIPTSWQSALPEQYRAALSARGASLACISQIGVI